MTGCGGSIITISASGRGNLSVRSSSFVGSFSDSFSSSVNSITESVDEDPEEDGGVDSESLSSWGGGNVLIFRAAFLFARSKTRLGMVLRVG